MKNKFIEFARLPEKVFEAAVEHFDDADERANFLKIVAASKISFILEITQGLSTREARTVIQLICNIDDCLTTFDTDSFMDHKVLKKIVEEYKK